MKEKLISNITLQKLVKGNNKRSMKNYKSNFLSVSSMSTEHMQLSEHESSQESKQLQSSAAESEIEEDDIRQKYKSEICPPSISM